MYHVFYVQNQERPHETQTDSYIYFGRRDILVLVFIMIFRAFSLKFVVIHLYTYFMKGKQGLWLEYNFMCIQPPDKTRK